MEDDKTIFQLTFFLGHPVSKGTGHVIVIVQYVSNESLRICPQHCILSLITLHSRPVTPFKNKKMGMLKNKQIFRILDQIFRVSLWNGLFLFLHWGELEGMLTVPLISELTKFYFLLIVFNKFKQILITIK